MIPRRLAWSVAVLFSLAACTGVGVRWQAGAGTVSDGASPSGDFWPDEGPPRGAGNQARVTVAPVVGPQMTLTLAEFDQVGEVLRVAGLTLPSGRVLSVKQRRVLPGVGMRGAIFVNGERSDLDRRLQAGDAVTMVRGADVGEGTETVTVPIAASGAGSLYTGAVPGTLRVVRGRLSQEVVSRKLVVMPKAGRLIRPGAVALTFDDGPDPRWTPQVLDLLAQARVQATFCLVGREAAARPELVRAIAAAGHALCNHTYNHDVHLPTGGPRRVHDELARASAAIRTASGGVAPIFFRAPAGNTSRAVEAEARRQRLTPLPWSVDPRDWARPGTNEIIATVLRDVRPGSVILLHDAGGDRAQSVAALRVLLTRLPAMGYTFVIPPLA